MNKTKESFARYGQVYRKQYFSVRQQVIDIIGFHILAHRENIQVSDMPLFELLTIEKFLIVKMFNDYLQLLVNLPALISTVTVNNIVDYSNMYSITW